MIPRDLQRYVKVSPGRRDGLSRDLNRCGYQPGGNAAVQSPQQFIKPSRYNEATGNIFKDWNAKEAGRYPITSYKNYDAINTSTKDLTQKQLCKAVTHIRNDLMSEGGVDLEPTLKKIEPHSYELNVSKGFYSGVETVTARFHSLKTVKTLQPESVTRTFVEV